MAQAGRVGGVTVATNMAGRGVDIILGGNPEGLAAREASARGIDLDHRGGRRRAGPHRGGVRGALHDRGRGGPGPGRPLRAGQRAPREPSHRQPAAWPVGPPGRPGREPVLPVARGRPDAAVRHRGHELGDGPGPARRRAHRGEDGHQGDRAGAEHRRGPQRRVPQGRPQVRRRDERAAQGHLRPAHADHRGRGPAGRHRRAARDDADRGRGLRRARRTTPRSGTSPASSPSSPSTTRPSSWPTTSPRRHGRPGHRERHHRGPRALRRAGRDDPRAARRRPASSSGTSCCRSSTSAGRTTWPTWTT